jgi:carboxylesterase type B
MTALLKTSFGTFRGKKGDGITQYRGIKYASVKDQLSAPEMVTGYGDQEIDATHFGYQAS